MSNNNKGKTSDRSQVRPIISFSSSCGATSRAKEVGMVGEDDSRGMQKDECDEFVGALAVFEREVRGLAKKLADERHLREKALPTELQATHCASTEEEGGEEERSFSATAALAGVTATRASTTRSLASVTGNRFHRPPIPSATAFAAANDVKDKRKTTIPTCDTSCVQTVALNVWATLGFFALPPFEVELPVGVSSAPVEHTAKAEEKEEEEEDSIFAFVEALAGYYQRKLAMTAASGKIEALLSDEMLCNGLWLVVFNALFYCVTAPGTDFQFDARDLECLFVATEDLDDVLCASSSSLSSSPELEEDSAGSGRQEGKGTGCKRVPTRLQWEVRMAAKEGARRRPQQQQEAGSAFIPRHRLTPAALRGSRRHAEPDAGMNERGGSPLLSSNPATVSAEPATKRAELIERLRHRSIPFGGRLAVPPSIMLWYFVVHTFAQLGYRRDAFYVQTPLRSSIHELLLALLWLTKENQLVAVAEYVQLQRTYAFLLQQGGPVTHDGNCHPQYDDRNPRDDAVRAGVGREYTSSATPHDPVGEALLRCFPAAVPWPPASFVEEESIAYRLEQIRRILPAALDERDALRMHFPELTRRLLSMQRLITLSVNRIERALHQRTEQTVSLGLHSALDAQLCHPAHHGAYRQLCAGLQHLCGMEARVRETTQQLSQLGSLVARAVRLEMSSVQQQRLEAEVVKALEDDELTWLRQPLGEEGKHEGSARWNLNETFIRFRATGVREQLTDLWASLRRRAHVGGRRGDGPHGTRNCVAESAELQAQLEEKVRENMRGRYSLDAALKAELRRWQMCGADATRHDVAAAAVGNHGEEGFESKNGAEGENLLFAAPELRGGSGRAHLSATKRLKKLKLPFVTFDLVTSHISSHRPQATAVGEPAANATTSARLEMERLHEAFLALAQQEEYLAKRVEEQRLGKEAGELLREHGLRVVPRRRA
ncbi:hypothetical protein TraAM80_07108 [Trypanosoma rangeli]|uniref:Uncharacterized protein n=1 Tax=Trypanosoma rangeli TaxID=5698 RepID=A0A3R7K7W4_TRYRA|nr:uncharacterized protein TraAM80_07108 [Trypanosoma rangeli]RNF01441.1 hypothetical protein TraAM80_07108 [Trypanosoma rangeli]|eukprot:RNF01441.1 hypothetical protein TraAM80_07108 [Trypanosoma rangeli]